MTEPVVCEKCLAEGDTTTFVDVGFRGPDGEVYDRWLCPPCWRGVEDEALSHMGD